MHVAHKTAMEPECWRIVTKRGRVHSSSDEFTQWGEIVWAGVDECSIWCPVCGLWHSM